MKRILSFLMALILIASTPLPAAAADAGDVSDILIADIEETDAGAPTDAGETGSAGEETPENSSEPASEASAPSIIIEDQEEIIEPVSDLGADDQDAVSPVAEGGPQGVKLMYLDPSKFTLSDSKREFSGDEKEYKTVQLTDGKLAELPDGPSIAGWKFVAWYTAPVKYAFWGDKTTTTYSEYEDIPFETDCEGNSYSEKLLSTGTEVVEGGGGWSEKLTAYWIWLSTLKESGKKAQTGDTMEDGTSLYALYKPMSIQYKLYYQGWKKMEGALICGRQAGTPFGGVSSSWEGYVFDGWFDKDGHKVESFYSVPADNANYYAHWHKGSDGDVNQGTYRQVGYEPVISLSLRDDDVGKGQKELGERIQFSDGKGTKNIVVYVNPYDCGVTDLDWELSNNDIVKITNRTSDPSNKLSFRIDATGKQGTVTLTVKTKDGKCSDSVVIDTSGHKFDKSEVVQWGDCATPTKILYTCVICGKTELQESYKAHTWAYRDIPATCTTDHIWEHYCKVCDKADPETDNNLYRGPANGHHFQIAQTADCEGTVTTKTCTVCGYTESSNDGIPVHTWGSETVDVQPTCKSKGSKSVKCLICGTVKEGSRVDIPIDPAGHNWSTWSVEKKATVTEQGVEKRTCTICEAVETRYVQSLDRGSQPADASKVKTAETAETDSPIDADAGSVADYQQNMDAGKLTQPAAKADVPRTEAAKAVSSVAAGAGSDVNIIASDITKTASAKSQSFSLGAKASGGAGLTYSSDNKSVAVNSSGKVTIKANFVGKAAVTVKSEKAAKKVTVTVNPPKVALSSVKNKSGKKMKVSWKKNSLVTGYQIRYSTDKKFKSGVKTATASKKTKTSITVSKLTKKKTYYVQIRTYKTVSGKKYYSDWSNAKKVKISK